MRGSQQVTSLQRMQLRPSGLDRWGVSRSRSITERWAADKSAECVAALCLLCGVRVNARVHFVRTFRHQVAVHAVRSEVE